MKGTIIRRCKTNTQFQRIYRGERKKNNQMSVGICGLNLLFLPYIQFNLIFSHRSHIHAHVCIRTHMSSCVWERNVLLRNEECQPKGNARQEQNSPVCCAFGSAVFSLNVSLNHAFACTFFFRSFLSSLALIVSVHAYFVWYCCHRFCLNDVGSEQIFTNQMIINWRNCDFGQSDACSLWSFKHMFFLECTILVVDFGDGHERRRHLWMIDS